MIPARRPIALAVAVAIATSGCATASKDIASNYVSPVQYQGYDCEQLAAEAQRLQSRVVQLGGRLDEAASNDAALMGVGLVLFWPALFALGGTKQQETEYGRLKGEYDAVQQAAIAKKCPAGGPAVAAASPGASAAPAAGAGAVAAAGSATEGSAAGAPSSIGAFAVGDRLDYRISDSISNATLAEQTLVITRVGDGRIEYDHGDHVTDLSGNWTGGRASGLKLIGVFRPSYLAGGSWKGRIESSADATMRADVDVRLAAPTGFTAKGFDAQATRLLLSGYAAPVGMNSVVHPVRGEILVDAASGVLLDLRIDTNHPKLGTHRTLTARIRP